MKWTQRADGHRYARHAGHILRCRCTLTGYIISRKDGDEWQFIAGDVRREVAERKAEDWFSK